MRFWELVLVEIVLYDRIHFVSEGVISTFVWLKHFAHGVGLTFSRRLARDVTGDNSIQIPSPFADIFRGGR